MTTPSQQLQKVPAILRERLQPFLKFSSSRTIKPTSLKFEISILITLLMGANLIIVCVGLYWILSQTLYRELDNNLTLKAQGISQVIRSYLEVHGEDATALKNAVIQTITQSAPQTKWWMFGFQRRWHGLIEELNLGEEYINFASYTGASLYRSSNMTDELTSMFNKYIPVQRVNNVFFADIQFGPQKMRIINYPFNYRNEFQFLVQVGVFPRPIVLLLENWAHSILAAIPIIMILTFFIGQLLASRILSPIRKITATARKITSEDLSERIEAEYFYKEMNQLVESFNDMISRLERSFKHIEEFGAHVAHELKTPLTVIKGEAELTLMKERGKDEYQKALRINLEECDKMLKIIEDLLLLSRMDYQPEVFKFRMVNLAELMQGIYEQGKLLAYKKKIQVMLKNPYKEVIIRGDPIHLERLFLNLLDNALKFTPVEGKIDVVIRKKDRNVFVSVKDSGIGMAPEELDKIFSRFYRINPQVKGSGLGLNIALTIAKYHQGTIQVESVPRQGSVFTVVFPST